MKTIAVYVLALAVVVPLVLGIWWLMWSLWTWVLPQVWANGPDAVVRPSYWLFVGELLLLGLIGRAIFPSKT